MNEPDKRKDELSSLYHDGAKPEPSAALDAAILAAARDAAGGDARGTAPVANRKNRMAQWRLPFALAATVVMSVAVTTMVREQQPDDHVFSTPEATKAQAAIEHEARVAESGANVASPVAPADIARATRSISPALRVEPQARPAYEPKLSTHEERQFAADAMPPPPSMPAPAAAAASAPMRERMDTTGQTEMSVGASSGALAADTATRSTSDKKAEAVMAAPKPAEKSAFSSGLRQAPAMRAAETQAETKVRQDRSPESAIADIRELRRVGRMTEAAARLVEFRKQFPDYKLPEDLQ